MAAVGKKERSQTARKEGFIKKIQEVGRKNNTQMLGT